ncbi:Mov34/MPN/PAD-1 family protein [Rhizorhapis sp. SPR117]|uniref:Mov34/MPN/PAD-1 family protein n=1 Tax=Rhizorhapis sp. SPR117 TaxID=2912611 RepID=UPI001F3F4F29|nr:M67 family metallopeptidase [Rhizorhapis sp. SPR117]
MDIRISRDLLERILADAAAGQGEERCGLLLGEAGHIRDVRFAANVALDPTRHFELDPGILLATYKAARAGGARILGHYHSHPSGTVIPSAADGQCAAPDGSLWLIVAGMQAALWRAGHTGELHGRFQAESLEIYDDLTLA